MLVEPVPTAIARLIPTHHLWPVSCVTASPFWVPDQFELETPWLEHAPFFYWLLGKSSPRIAVEWGDCSGFSYFSLCQAVARLELGTMCFGIDFRQEKPRAGMDRDGFSKRLRQRNETYFSKFSTLNHLTSEEACERFKDSSIDLLHIDARRLQSNVKPHFELWGPKLSERAVVLLHNISMREGEAGVSSLWAELSAIHPYFEFTHGQGFGVVAIGEQVLSSLRDLTMIAPDTNAAEELRSFYARLGRKLSVTHLTEWKIEEARQAQSRSQGSSPDLASNSAPSLPPEAGVSGADIRAKQEALAVERLLVLDQLHAVMESTSWIVTTPLRILGTRMPTLAFYGRRALLAILPKDRYGPLRTKGRSRFVPVIETLASRRDETNDLNHGVNTYSRSIRYHVDRPFIGDGTVPRVADIFVVEGWVIARGGVATVKVEVDGRPVGSAYYGIPRPDVYSRFKEEDDTLNCGFRFQCPTAHLGSGECTATLIVRGRSGELESISFQISIVQSELNSGRRHGLRYEIGHGERQHLVEFAKQPVKASFHVVVVDSGSVDDSCRRATILSLANQVWDNWKVTIIAKNAYRAAAAGQAVARCAPDLRSRFVVADAQGQSPPSSFETDMSFTCVCNMGDEFGIDALNSFAIAISSNPSADVLYADEVRIAPGHDSPSPFFKPDYSPGLLLSTNYIGRGFVVRSSLINEIKLTIPELVEFGEYNFVLRCAESATNVHHLSSLLVRTDLGGCERGDAQKLALVRALARRGPNSWIEPGAVPGSWRSRPKEPITGRVSIIIPTCAANGRIRVCIDSIRQKTSYRNFEIVCPENVPKDQSAWRQFLIGNADKVINIVDEFNWSRFNNLAVDICEGEYLLFLNDDTEITEPDWLNALLEEAVRPNVGAVGARLLYPNGTVQHAGMFLGVGIGRHLFRHAARADSGYFGLAMTRREVIAVTGACMMVRRDVFEALGRFDERHKVINNDLDFCLRAHRAGRKNIYTPFASLIHHECESRKGLPEEYDAGAFYRAWRHEFAKGDPFHNPHLSRDTDYLQADYEKFEAKVMERRRIQKSDIQRILVVKLDHIGDFVTALPAIRQLKLLFPSASITVLGAPSSRALAGSEEAIDEFIPFVFFHAKSQLGLRDVSPAEMKELGQRLSSLHFDLAIDLRKHPETRHILRHSGAKILVGYEVAEQFPWLDIALEFVGDKPRYPKRYHITEDLLNLVGAIDSALDRDRPRTSLTPMPVARMPYRIRHLFDRPVVAIHPGAGTETRQWPSTHFADLISLFIDRNDVGVVLIGGKDDAALIDEIVEAVDRADRLGFTVGEIDIEDLPRFLSACSLFVGNNSGPTHVASESGVPTIGVYSGVVDAGEWGPGGSCSMVVRREMTCSPCYISLIKDCPREYACMRYLSPALVYQSAQIYLSGITAVESKFDQLQLQGSE
jgi:ADP-heptose:LPS heptosyltransferase/GT2 family glycosyltransferase